MAPSDFNLIASQRRAAQRNSSHKMLLVQEIRAADCMKYSCLQSKQQTSKSRSGLVSQARL
jgi:hypothetical protein